MILLLNLIPISQSQAADVIYPGDRPFTLVLPNNYQSGTPAPLIIGLHGYTAKSPYAQSYFALARLLMKKEFSLSIQAEVRIPTDLYFGMQHLLVVTLMQAK